MVFPYASACHRWLSLDPRYDGCGEAGRQVMTKLRGLVEEEALRKVSTATLIYHRLPPHIVWRVYSVIRTGQ